MLWETIGVDCTHGETTVIFLEPQLTPIGQQVPNVP